MTRAVLPGWLQPILKSRTKRPAPKRKSCRERLRQIFPQVDPLVVRDAVASVFIVAAVVAKLGGATLMLSSGWRGGFIIPLFFVGAALGRLVHVIAPGANEVVVMSALMAACVVGVTKATIGSTLVVTEMAGLQLLPTTLVASLAALWLTSNVGLIETQREREEKADFGGGRTRAALTSALTRLCTMSKCEATGAVLRP